MKALRARMLGNHLLRSGQYVFAVIGIVALGYWASVSAHARLFQSREAHHLAQAALARQNARSESSAELRQQAPVEGSVIANLTIPRIGLATVVVEGAGDGELKLAAGHIPGTPLPGESGNVVIAAHRDTFFRPLRLIHKDDVIALTTPHEEDQYRVVSTKIVDPDDVGVLYPTSRDTLTLVTCYPFYYLGAAPKRFIVRAERDKTPTRESTMTMPLTEGFK